MLGDTNIARVEWRFNFDLLQSQHFLNHVRTFFWIKLVLSNKDNVPDLSRMLMTEFEPVPDWRQMAIENTVSSNFWSAFVEC